MELTIDNYYSSENKAISNSKVSDYLASKKYYFERHVAHSVPEQEISRSMLLGKIVDRGFSTGKPVDRSEFDGAKGVTDKLWEQAENMVSTLLSADFYRFYANETEGDRWSFFQSPLSDTLVKGTKKRTAVEICGLPDVYTVEKSGKKVTVYVDDLKTAAPGAMRTATCWYWHCLSYGYLRQMACYSHLLGKSYPKAEIVARHVVISSHAERGSHRVKLFLIPQDILKPHLDTFLRTAKAMAKEKEWKDPPICWNRAERLTRPGGEPVVTEPEE